jgi:hypothetical protein
MSDMVDYARRPSPLVGEGVASATAPIVTTRVRGVGALSSDHGTRTPHPSRRYAPSHLLPKGEKAR